MPALYRNEPYPRIDAYSTRSIRWNSYRTHVHGKPSTMVTPHSLYQQLGDTSADRQTTYHSLFTNQLPVELIETINQATLSGLALGNDRFKNQIDQLTGQSVQMRNQADQLINRIEQTTSRGYLRVEQNKSQKQQSPANRGLLLIQGTDEGEL